MREGGVDKGGQIRPFLSHSVAIISLTTLLGHSVS